MITCADSSMIPDLKQIWKECFQDEDAYIDFYFQYRYADENTLVWQEDKIPVAMLTLLPAHLFHKGKYEPLLYVYAVATKTAWRKKGISSRLLKAIDKNSVLVPATKQLFEFYEKAGYKNAFSLRQVEISVAEIKEDIQDIACLPITSREYKILRDQRFLKEGYVCWDLAAVTYALAENQFNGGFAYKVKQGIKEDIVLGYQKGDRLYIKETTLKGNDLKAALKGLAKKQDCQHITAMLPIDAADIGTISEFGRSNFPVSTEGYLGLALN